MSSEQAANAASLSMHNKNMEIGRKRRYIEVFQCSIEEMNSFLNPVQSLATSLQLPLTLTASNLSQNGIQLAPHLQNVYRNLNFAHPIQHLPLPVSFAHQPQMNLLGVGIPAASFGTAINPLQMFSNDPQLIQQQQVRFNQLLVDRYN